MKLTDSEKPAQVAPRPLRGPKLVVNMSPEEFAQVLTAPLAQMMGEMGEIKALLSPKEESATAEKAAQPNAVEQKLRDPYEKFLRSMFAQASTTQKSAGPWDGQPLAPFLNAVLPYGVETKSAPESDQAKLKAKREATDRWLREYVAREKPKQKAQRVVSNVELSSTGRVKYKVLPLRQQRPN